jgi:hypothetical protein
MIGDIIDYVPVTDLRHGRRATANAGGKKSIVSATPFAWRDPARIPPRKWLYGRDYVRRFLTYTVAAGGVGKTSLAIVEALTMASGRPLLGVTPSERCRVWLWNGEDPAEELQRRIVAAMLHHGLKPEDVEGYLFCDTGREMPIVLATQSRTGTTIARPVVEEIIATIRRNQIDVMIVDPFVKSHQVSENDNGAIDATATQWAAIADIANCNVELLHHSRKNGGGEVTVEDSRGASALLSAARAARTQNKMTKEEARDAGIDKRSAWRYVRVDNGKANMAPPPERADWYTLASVPLGNGDDVGVAKSWRWPSPFDGVTVDDLKAAQREVAMGGPWRSNGQADMWVGVPIARALNLNVKTDRKKILSLLRTWLATGMFVEVVRKAGNRHKKRFVEVGQWAND